MLGGRDFRDEYRGDTSESSSTKSSDDTSDDDKVGALRGSLESTSDASKDGGKEETVDTTNAIGCPTADEASNDASEVVLNGECRRVVVSFRFESLYGKKDSIYSPH